MRAFKFRAWVKTACFGEGLMIYQNSDTDYGMVSNGDGFGVHNPNNDWLKDNEFEVMQYTGLNDKNGTPIYEGDVVKFGKNIYQIIHECGGFCLLDKSGEMINKIGGINDHCYSLVNLYIECCWEENFAFDIEVIGNIYENPELLRANQ